MHKIINISVFPIFLLTCTTSDSFSLAANALYTVALEGDPWSANRGSISLCRVKYTPFPLKLKYSPCPLSVDSFSSKVTVCGSPKQVALGHEKTYLLKYRRHFCRADMSADRLAIKKSYYRVAAAVLARHLIMKETGYHREASIRMNAVEELCIWLAHH